MTAKPAITNEALAAQAARFGISALEAAAESVAILLDGAGEVTRSLFQLSQTQLDANYDAAKALADVKTLGELGSLHRAYARTAFDNAVSEASRLTELAMRVSSEAVEPVGARFQILIDRLPKPPLAA